MFSNEIETNDVNGPRLAEQGPSSGRCSRQGTLVAIMRFLSLVREENGLVKRSRDQENKIVMECYLLSEPKIRGHRNRMLSS